MIVPEESCIYDTAGNGARTMVSLVVGGPERDHATFHSATCSCFYVTLNSCISKLIVVIVFRKYFIDLLGNFGKCSDKKGNEMNRRF